MDQKEIINKLVEAGCPENLQEGLADIMLGIYDEAFEEGRQEVLNDIEMQISYEGHTADQLAHTIAILEEQRNTFQDPQELINELTKELCKLQRPLGYKPPKNKKTFNGKKFQ